MRKFLLPAKNSRYFFSLFLEKYRFFVDRILAMVIMYVRLKKQKEIW